MAIESITCPNCGNTGIQIDTAREHSFCSYCGSTLKTKDVLHLETEGMTLEKLRRNAQLSFEVEQYGNAKADWQQATQLDRTDYESYWNIVRCDMATQPDKIIGQTGYYAQALAYAPQDAKAEYEACVKEHNVKAVELQRKAKKIQRKSNMLIFFLVLFCVGALICSFVAPFWIDEEFRGFHDKELFNIAIWAVPSWLGVVISAVSLKKLKSQR